MLKSLIFELLRSSISQEEKSYGKPFVYLFNILGLILILIANYYSQTMKEFYFLMNSGIISIIISIIIEAIRCYLKYRNKYRTLNTIKATSKKLVNNVSSQLTGLVSAKTLIKYAPTIIRYIPTSILTFLICNYIKGKFKKNTGS